MELLHEEAHKANESSLGEQLDWLLRAESGSPEADKTDVRDCMGRETVWCVSGIHG